MTHIEILFLGELRRIAALASEPIAPLSVDRFWRPALLKHGLDINRAVERIASWFVFQELTVGPYRVDFALANHDGGLVCVECDGHDYHERTREQAEHDRRRDRYFQARGWRVMRFTGSEIVRDSRACGEELWELLRVIDRQQRDALDVRLRIAEGALDPHGEDP